MQKEEEEEEEEEEVVGGERRYLRMDHTMTSMGDTGPITPSEFRLVRRWPSPSLWQHPPNPLGALSTSAIPARPLKRGMSQ